MSKIRFDAELVCADCLTHYLKDKGGCNSILIKRNKDDPPDFWFTIDGEKFAVEITSIVKDQGYLANINKLTENIQQSAQDNNVLSGKYVLIIFRKPNIPRKNTPEWNNLVNKTTSFIKATKNIGSTDKTELFKDFNGYIAIAKADQHSNTVVCMFTTQFQWEGDTQTELTQLMQKAVDEKQKKLEEKGVPSNCPQNILMFYDAYGYGDIEDAQTALLKVEGYRWFHSVFWVSSFTNRQNELYPNEPGRTGIFLYSTNLTWWPNVSTN